MASDLWLVIAQPETGAIVQERWLGMGATLAVFREQLARPPTIRRRGFESWADLRENDVLVALERAPNGDSPALEDISALADRFPDDKFWWCLVRGF